jgi:hypothetical protein
MKRLVIALVLLLFAVARADDGWHWQERLFYWDDGVLANGWAWWTGGNYWAVQFDEEKTGGSNYAYVTEYGAMTYPNWPDGTYQGVYLHTFEHTVGGPGLDLDSTFFLFTAGGIFQWVEPDRWVELSTVTFYIAFEQINNYPSCDSIAVDAEAGTHNWTGYQGSWQPTTFFGDFMLRCIWRGPRLHDDEVTGVSWGELKAAYGELESLIGGEPTASPDEPAGMKRMRNAWRAIRQLYR